MVIIISSRDNMNHDIDDVMISSLHYATLTNIVGDGTINRRWILFLNPYFNPLLLIMIL